MVDSGPIKELTEALGFDLCGVCSAVTAPHHEFLGQWLDSGHHAGMDYMAEQAELRRSPDSLLPGVRSLIVVGLNYSQPKMDQDPGAPKIAKYALGRDYHKVIRSRLKKVAEMLTALEPDSRSRICVDSAPLMERDFARLAGLGWFGKNTMIINSVRGSYFVIGSILTTVEIAEDKPAEGGCGSCRACIDACPTGAIVSGNGRWEIDSRRCISYATIEHKGEIALDTHGWTFGCDICQDVCPFNQRRDSQPLRAAATSDREVIGSKSWPSIGELADLSVEDWDRLTQGTAVRRAGYQGLRRNAILNLRTVDR